MTAQLIDGNALSKKIRADVAQRTAALRATLRVYELRTAREVEAFLRATAQIRASE